MTDKDVENNNELGEIDNIYGLFFQDFDHSSIKIIPSYRLGDMKTTMLLSTLTNDDKVIRFIYNNKEAFCFNFANKEALQGLIDAATTLLKTYD